MIASMKRLTTEYILLNKDKWREGVSFQTVMVEKIHLEKFNGRNKLKISTVDGYVEINKNDYIKALRESNENTLYILYNVSVNSNDDKKVKRKFTSFKGEKVLDRIVINQRLLSTLKYKKYKYGTYKKLHKKINFFVLKEDVFLDLNNKSFKGKPGDVVVIYGKNDYMVYDRNTFSENFEVL